MKKFSKLLGMVLALTMLCSALPTALATVAGVKAQREANPNWHTWYNYIHEKVNWYKNVDELRAQGDWTLTEKDFEGKGLNYTAQHRDTAPEGLAAATGGDSTYGDPVATWTYLNNNFDTRVADYWAQLLLGTATGGGQFYHYKDAKDPQNGVAGANKYLTYLTAQFDNDIADLKNIYGVSAMRSFASRMGIGGFEGHIDSHGMVDGSADELVVNWLTTDGDYNTCYVNFIQEGKLVPQALAAPKDAAVAYMRDVYQERFRIKANDTWVEVMALPVVDNDGNTTVYVKGIGDVYKAMGVKLTRYADITCYSTSDEGDAANKAALQATVAKVAADKAAAEKAETDAINAVLTSRKAPEAPVNQGPIDSAISHTTVLVNGKQVQQTIATWFYNYSPWSGAPSYVGDYYNVTDIGEALGFLFGQEHGDSSNSGEVFVIADSAHAPKRENPPVSSVTVTVNGKPTQFETVIMTSKKGGSTSYFKLRDIGAAMGFKVEWDHTWGISISNDAPPVKNYVTRIPKGSGATNIVSVTANGVRVGIPAVAILDAAGGATTYFKIRDVATIMGFNVDWNAATGIALSN